MPKRDNKKFGSGVRTFIPFDTHDNLGFHLELPTASVHFDIMIHPCQDDPKGVIVWFEANGEVK